jgi:uncharacterized membrane protein (DUF2068 family)
VHRVDRIIKLLPIPINITVKFKIPPTYRGRPIGLLAIVAYKLVITVLFSIVALAVFLTLKNVSSLQEIAATYELEGKHQIITLLLDKLLNITPKTLKFSGFAAAGYSFLSGVEAIGLWRQKAWAHVLVLVLVGISIPPEIYEIFKGITVVKSVVFLLNVAVFSYLLTHLPKRRHHRKS